MTATLYQPNKPALILSADGLSLPNSDGYAIVTERVAELLNCPLGMVDVLASGNNYAAYSIFDDEGEANLFAMAALSAITGYSFNTESEEEIVSGKVLIISRI